jgi:ADP-ribose pyrophosphatase YjhB (NUDIX family)
MNKNINSNTCNNCGKSGHLFHQCKLPIISYGLIAFRINETTSNIEYLMIRRKHSFGFIDLVRGKYNLNNLDYLQNIINEMSNQEKNIIQNNDFNTLWQQMWGDTPMNNQYKYEENISQKKFEYIKNNIEKKNIQFLINNSNTYWEETEWEFPKGRKNNNEKDVDCALREFEEETGYSKDKVKLINNLLPFEETYIGTNYKSYKHKYFIGLIDKPDNLVINYNYQKNEVSCVKWKTLEECLISIRPYNLEKKQLIKNINKVLQEYRLY